MARDRASIRVDMWGDDDWRGLTMPAQHLYMMLLSHATLSYAGVADWRPGRLASLIRDGSVDGVKAAAVELQVARFVLVDEVTEEVLVRSFLKHDGLMKQPRLAVSMAKAFAGIASEKIRSVVSFELQKLRGAAPELSAWELKQVQTVLAAKGSPIEAFTQGLTPLFTPNVTPLFGPNIGEGFDEHTSTSTSTSTTSKEVIKERPAVRGSRLSEDWKPSAENIQTIRAECPGIDPELEHRVFVDYWIAQPGQKGVKVDWEATWRNWMRRKQSDVKPASGARVTAGQKARSIADDFRRDGL